MKRAKLQLKTYAGRVQIVDSGHLERRVLRLILSSLGALALFYTLILGNMIWNIVERRALEGEAHALSTEVAELELSYLGLASKVDMNLGLSMGFREVKTEFASRKTLGSSKVAQNEL